jgi:hypothetical protein
VPFLAFFPKLERAYLGGLYRDVVGTIKYPYFNNHCERPRDHRSIFRSLVENICGAFQARVLNPNLRIRGVLEAGQFRCEEGESNEDGEDGEDGVCRLCWNVATSFPLGHVTKRTDFLCLPLPKCFETMASRPRNQLQLHSQAITKCFLDYVAPAIEEFDVDGHDPVYRIGKSELETLTECSAFIAPFIIKVPKSELPYMLRPREDGTKVKMHRETFEALARLGLVLDSNDFVLVDSIG